MYKPRNIVFIGTDSCLLKPLSQNNETEVISSVSFLSTLVQRFSPHLLVFDNLKHYGIEEIRKQTGLEKVPILILEDSFKNFNNLNSITEFSRIMICNQNVAQSQEFLTSLELLLQEKKQMLPAKSSNLVKYAILFINKNFTRKIDRNQIAEQVGTAPDYLSRIFKKELGVGLWNYVNIMRLDLSHNLLLHTGKSVSQISSECGFEDPAYFTRIFTKTFGVSPGRIR